MKLEDVIARERMTVERAVVVLSKVKCVEYAFHPETTYLLCFESALTPQQVQALRAIFTGKENNIFVISGGEEPKVFQLVDGGQFSFLKNGYF